MHQEITFIGNALLLWYPHQVIDRWKKEFFKHTYYITTCKSHIIHIQLCEHTFSDIQTDVWCGVIGRPPVIRRYGYLQSTTTAEPATVKAE